MFLLLWHLTGNEKYRDLADDIIYSGCSAQGDLFDDIMAGIVPAALGNGKAYEMTSCVQGLAELTLLDPDVRRQEIVKRYYEAVRDRELFVTGTGGGKDRCGEYWHDGAFRQTRFSPGIGFGETCVTATWTIRILLRGLTSRTIWLLLLTDADMPTRATGVVTMSMY